MGEKSDWEKQVGKRKGRQCNRDCQETSGKNNILQNIKRVICVATVIACVIVVCVSSMCACLHVVDVACDGCVVHRQPHLLHIHAAPTLFVHPMCGMQRCYNAQQTSNMLLRSIRVVAVYHLCCFLSLMCVLLTH